MLFVIDKPKLQRIIALIRDDRTAGMRARGGHYLLSRERRSPERLFFANRRQGANAETCLPAGRLAFPGRPAIWGRPACRPGRWQAGLSA